MHDKVPSSMTQTRVYGSPPHSVAVVHGGPGAAGEMAPVARELSDEFGVIEPLQSAKSVEGQIGELASAVAEHCATPVSMVGYSWGAWLACLTASRYPERIRNLILVSAGPFEERYADDITKTRLARLSFDDRAEFDMLIAVLNNVSRGEKDTVFARIGALFSKADTFDPVEDHDSNDMECRADIFEAVWPEAAELRRNGQLLEAAGTITCPVLAIHGEYDPHPAAGVRDPLSAALQNFRFILLPYCGHTPWMEHAARDDFFHILRKELRLHR